ncbi:hypothetical protein [Ferruginivarius sediminum]|uniref:Uncharacterized protein n=1 Tax=Ferruginivarius sediminum TaxID=2661937 RepID=A0A369T5C3_9PROT|nr:hypothetical protein [Ferruginivarius sediminum]RDD60519.1 hypothetical protein DRB17_17630 [Ferruginivarius sediminum]
MVMIRRTVALVATVVLLGGCGFTEDALMPSVTGEAPSDEAEQSQASRDSDGQAGSGAASARTTGMSGDTGVVQGTNGAVGGAARGIPSLGTTVFEPGELPRFEPTGTFVGNKVGELRKDLSKLRGNISQHNRRLQELRGQTRSSARAYHGLVATMNTRLQIGTTPGNPEMVQQWNRAQAELARVDQVASRMNELANDVSSTSALAAYLLESVQAAYSLSGAIERDHEHLAILEDATNRTVVLIDRLLNELSEDVARQNSYLGRERQNLSTLSLAIKNGEFYGGSLANQAYGAPQPPSSNRDPASLVGSSQPLVVIRFGQDNVKYEQALYNAVSRALDRRPQAAFDVVAVAPQTGNKAEAALDRAKARRYAERVLRSLNDMGLPPNRVSLAATTSQGADSNEVHVYVR